MSQPVALQVIFEAARTTSDGGWRLSFDTHSDMGKQVIALNDLKGHSLYLVVMTDEQYEKANNRK